VSVYVDDFYTPYRNMKMCHMLADSLEELHAMADQLGLKRSWFQGDHYDICMSKRALAVKFGAVEVSTREIVRVRQRFRQKHGMDTRMMDALVEMEEEIAGE
jgi:hypothetical protein